MTGTSALPRLLERYPLDARVRGLIAAKAREKSALDDGELAAHGRIIDVLRARLEEGFRSSRLPTEPARARDPDEFLVRLRMASAPPR